MKTFFLIQYRRTFSPFALKFFLSNVIGIKHFHNCDRTTDSKNLFKTGQLYTILNLFHSSYCPAKLKVAPPLKHKTLHVPFPPPLNSRITTPPPPPTLTIPPPALTKSVVSLVKLHNIVESVILQVNHKSPSRSNCICSILVSNHSKKKKLVKQTVKNWHYPH